MLGISVVAITNLFTIFAVKSWMPQNEKKIELQARAPVPADEENAVSPVYATTVKEQDIRRVFSTFSNLDPKTHAKLKAPKKLTVQNLRERPGCSGCHATLDPLADFFLAWGEGEVDIGLPKRMIGENLSFVHPASNNIGMIPFGIPKKGFMSKLGIGSSVGCHVEFCFDFVA